MTREREDEPLAAIAAAKVSGDLVGHARRVMVDRLASLGAPLEQEEDWARLLPGKMLRTKLAARLVDCGRAAPQLQSAARFCAATEMAHTASLCHDDVIDGSCARRGQAALWRATSPSAAILIGDMLLCDALDLLLHTEGGRYLTSFVAKIREVCAAEAEHELLQRGRRLDVNTCLHIARSKTGPLFAFAAQACGGEDVELSSALEGAGYHIGTAYQIADDMLDMLGDENAAGKTLGTDLKRRKFTLPQTPEEGLRIAREHVLELCTAALDCLTAWPWARSAVVRFLSHDLQPVLPLDMLRPDTDAGPVS